MSTLGPECSRTNLHCNNAFDLEEECGLQCSQETGNWLEATLQALLQDRPNEEEVVDDGVVEEVVEWDEVLDGENDDEVEWDNFIDLHVYEYYALHHSYTEQYNLIQDFFYLLS